MILKTLGEIAEIFAGYTFRKAIKYDPLGQVAVLQANNLDPALLEIDSANLKTISKTPTRSISYVQKNDVIISARSSLSGNFKSAVLKKLKKPVIISSSVYIIRLLDPSSILPEYLILYLNSNIGQRIISQTATIATVKTILRNDLSNIKIPIPNLSTQQAFINIYKNTLKQEELIKRKILINKKIIKSTLQTIIKN